ncbi:hypothetical protein C1H76_9135 [Elsinoe australis]|uniref:Uncharacterized protein n=1 Tax=Elsinoe australis TaxID=40998 RepID=A0A4U7ATN0_9PEZI|nr:hypothetical protein C1H76_9135 [Elsinoe australis]
MGLDDGSKTGSVSAMELGALSIGGTDNTTLYEAIDETLGTRMHELQGSSPSVVSLGMAKGEDEDSVGEVVLHSPARLLLKSAGSSPCNLVGLLQSKYSKPMPTPSLQDVHVRMDGANLTISGTVDPNELFQKVEDFRREMMQALQHTSILEWQWPYVPIDLGLYPAQIRRSPSGDWRDRGGTRRVSCYGCWGKSKP